MSSLSESKSKRKLVFSNEEKKKKSGTVWSEEDDGSLLKGMIDFEEIKQANPYDDMGKFLDFVKPSLHFDVQRKQLTDRLWRLKKRYLDSLYDVSKPHHAKLFELSKLIKAWGCHANVSLDGDKSEDFVIGGGQNGESDGVDNVVVGDGNVDKSEKMSKNKEKGRLVTSDDQNGGEEKCLEVIRKKKKKKRKLVTRDGQNVEEVNVVLDDVNGGKCSEEVKNKKKGKVLTFDGQNDQEDAVVVTCDGDKSEKFVSSDGQNVLADNVAVDDVDVDKSKKISKNKEKGKLVTGDDQNGEKDNVGIVDVVHVDKCPKLVKKKRKLVIKDGQNVEEVNVVLDDVNVGKCLKEIKNKKKGKVLTCDGQNDQEDAVVVGDGKSEQAVNDKNKGNVVTCDDQIVEEDNVVVDELDDDSKSPQVVKGRNKGKDVTGDGQNVEENHVVVEVYGGKSDQVVDEYDVDGNKCSKLVKDKKMRKVVISDSQNVEEVDAFVDVDIQSAKKNGKKRVKVLGNENAPIVVNKKDSKDYTSMYPEITNTLELETLSRMPQHIKKKCVMDTINFMGREKANELEEEWADIRLMEMALNAKKLDLTSKQINLILEAMRR